MQEWWSEHFVLHPLAVGSLTETENAQHPYSQRKPWTKPPRTAAKCIVWLNCCAANDLVTFVANHTMSTMTAYKELEFWIFAQALMENDDH